MVVLEKILVLKEKTKEYIEDNGNAGISSILLVDNCGFRHQDRRDS